jgi:short-subunit dehydrogenase
MQLRDRVVVITGASSGIGAATALVAARRRARAVVLLARSGSALERLAAEVRALGVEALAEPVYLSEPLAAERAAAVRERLGTPDVLVNNAGAGRYPFVEETDPREALEMIAAPYFAAFNATRAFLPGMLERRSGHVVNVTSAAAYAPWPGATGRRRPLGHARVHGGAAR